MFDTKTFAERLKMSRNQKHISQADLAKAVGVSAATISSYETPNGTKIPALDKAAAIASFLEVPLDYLCGGELPNTPITDFTLETYLRGLVAVMSETTTEIYGDPTTTDELVVSISHPAIVDFARKSSDLLKVYRAGSLTMDLYISCIEKIISDVCKNYVFELGAVVSRGEKEALSQELIRIDAEGAGVCPGNAQFRLFDPNTNQSRSVCFFISDKDFEKLHNKKGTDKIG